MIEIPGFEGLYRIDNKQRIFGQRNNEKPQYLTQRGYKKVNLWRNNKSHSVLVHKIVALIYHNNPAKKRYVNHIDGNKLNNSPGNLEWCTISENIKHAYSIGKKVGARLGKKGSNHPRFKNK